LYLVIILVRTPGSKETVGFSGMLDKGCLFRVEISKGFIAAWGDGIYDSFLSKIVSTMYFYR
jgi:hypothetical protein